MDIWGQCYYSVYYNVDTIIFLRCKEMKFREGVFYLSVLSVL